MSNTAAWINAGGTTLVGTATIAANVLTKAAHGLTDGTAVAFDTITGGAIDILIEDHEYFVRDATTDTFTVSDTPGGAIMAIASGGAAVRTAAPEYSALDWRRLDAINGHPASADRLGVRTGVRPHATAAVTVSGTTWTVNPTLAWVYPRETSTSGPYRVYIEATSGTLTAADGSNPRLDALDVRVQDDDEDASGLRGVPPVLYTAGAPASSPTAPLLLPGYLRLATISVPVSGSPTPPDVATPSQFSHGPGILIARNAAELPSTGMPEGAYVDRWDTDALYRWNGSALELVASAATVTAANTAVRRIATSTRTSNSSGFSSEAVIHTISNVPVVSGRTYRITWVTDVASTAATTANIEVARWRIRETNIAGTSLQLAHTILVMTANDFPGLVVTEWVAPSTGTRTFVGTCHRHLGSGTFTCNANANEPSIMTVDQVLV